MPGIGPDLLEPRAIGVSCLYPLLLNDGFHQSFAYHRLPQQLLTLSVLKLDGSSFDVQVPMAASVAELKGAVQDTFSQVWEEEERVIISWPHVWGHFCLTYKRQKLTDDKSSIRTFGIRDGDQLRFIRHLSPTITQ